MILQRVMFILRAISPELKPFAAKRRNWVVSAAVHVMFMP
jgi:hypothetical protein